jgi:hypothetical protein
MVPKAEETYEKMGGLKSEKFTPRCLKNAQPETFIGTRLRCFNSSRSP